MEEYIKKSALVTEIERIKEQNPHIQHGDMLVNRDRSIRCNLLEDLLDFLDTLEVKEVDLEKEEEKLDKAIKLADAMYDAAQRLTTDASRLHKAMQDWWYFKNI